MFGAIKHCDIFNIMKLVGIKKEDYLFVFDSINNARNEVLRRNPQK